MAATSARLATLLKQLPLWWRNRVAAMRALDELRRSPGADVVRIASDFGLTVRALQSATARGPLSRQLMETMATTYGLSLAAIRRADPNWTRELEGRCTFCRHRLRCSIDLADADGAARARAYCPNAEIFRHLASGLAVAPQHV